MKCPDFRMLATISKTLRKQYHTGQISVGHVQPIGSVLQALVLTKKLLCFHSFVSPVSPDIVNHRSVSQERTRRCYLSRRPGSLWCCWVPPREPWWGTRVGRAQDRPAPDGRTLPAVISSPHPCIRGGCAPSRLTAPTSPRAATALVGF